MSDIQVPPTVLPFLLQQGAASPGHLLEMALNLRETDGNFIAYRRWNHEFREACLRGSHNETREADVVKVTKELAKRYPPGSDPVDAPPIWCREVGIKATVGAEAGLEGGIGRDLGGKKLKAGAKAELEADFGKVSVGLPDWIRNWLVEAIRFRSHMK